MRLGVRETEGNVLWINPEPEVYALRRGWNLWGGSRVLFTPQSMWKAAYGVARPDAVSNDVPWAVLEEQRDKVVLQSCVSPEQGVQMTREIRLVAGTSEVVQHYRLERLKPGRTPVFIWTLTHVPVNGTAWMEIDSDSPHRSGGCYHVFGQSRTENTGVAVSDCGSWLRVPLSVQNPLKLGTYGERIIWEGDDWQLWLQARRSDSGSYPDNSNLQVYIDGGENPFVELEAQSGMVDLEPGQALELEVRMGIKRRQPGQAGYFSEASK